MHAPLPYGDLFYPLLRAIHNALWYCYEYDKAKEEVSKGHRIPALSSVNRESIRKSFDKYKSIGELPELSPEDENLEEFFKPFESWFKKGRNKHISKGLTKSEKTKHGIYPRTVKLIIQSFNEAQEISSSPNAKGIVIPSPLAVLYQILTVPAEPQTSSYALVLCRSMLFSMLGTHPAHPDLTQGYQHLKPFDEQDILDSVASFRNYIRVQARWPDERSKEMTNYVVGHFLSMKSMAHLWFSDEEKLKDFCAFDEESDFETVRDKYRKPAYHFRIAGNYIDLPDSGEIINSLFGIPLPVRGGETVFFGGLKKTARSGLVMSLSGKPGAGKTSLALALAAVLSPIQTKCIYISLEEEKEDLLTRLVTLIPEYLKELSVYARLKKSDNTCEWFFPFKIEKNISLDTLTEVLDFLKRDLGQDEDKITSRSLPAVCPAYIVIDNINELVVNYTPSQYEAVEKFVSTCRNLGAMVVLIAAEDVPHKIRLDYLVDVSVQLRQTGTEDQQEKPIRIFQLTKTRHQVSRQGAHVFHLSGSSGLRISPQIPSQMDRKEKMKRELADRNRYIHTLSFIEDKNKVSYIDFVKVYPNTQILVHGYGSSGKAGFALRLLLTPAVDKSLDVNTDIIGKKRQFDLYSHRRKVLVISFLYSNEYYEGLVKRINPLIKGIYKDVKVPVVEILPFFPGFLSPEDFVNKIIRKLDEAVLEGEPYTGILLDGLHNVFLQFRNLQDNDMVWPLLYGILSRYRLTVVSTFTNFALTDKHIDLEPQQRNQMMSQAFEDHRLLQKGQAPFLHGLVKASDYYFLLEESIHPGDYERKYLLSVKSAIDNLSSDLLQWDRQNLKFIKKTSPEEFFKKKNTN